MPGALSGLTTRGRCLIAAGLAAAVCSVVLNERDLMRVSVFVVALPLLVCVVTAVSRVGLRAQRHISPVRVPVGGRAEVALSVQSTGRLPTVGLLVSDGVPYALGGKPRFLIEHLPRHTGTQLRYTLQPMLRGIQQIGPLKATVTDPFGLAEFERELAGTSRMVVVPRVVRLAGVPGGSGLGSGDDGSVRLNAGQGEDDAVVRPYRQGDDLRKVHWRSTAKRDEMMVRVEESPWRGGTTVLLDRRVAGHRGAGAGSSLEWAVSFAASVCVHLHRHGHQIRLVTETGGVLVSDAGDGAHSDTAVLDALAALQPVHQRDISCPADPGHGQELIAVLGAATPESVSQLIRYRTRGTRSLAVLLDTPAWGTGDGPDVDPTAAASLLAGAGWGVTIARPDVPMTQVWAGVCRTGNRRGDTMIAGAGT
ncbi:MULTISPECIES: DUF58 domain-containing protein [Actinokineospora]|uniref:Uncharacterized protein (DUF58 family) n=2 Tax=Actinokineospora TaxID=39845 RepID=A0A421BCS6_9PSEU|nr:MULTISPECIES: DUF58 domain-containing protein [Actinokineospora]RLK62179.1 uncharacterized protein (DUF58 family) [Actinokineospora cianjurensis]SER97804.1 Uncharacterized conserved protein, DUF58 family, contains vWF domain [Actinokineospora terrae]